jgi:AraC family transcriptional regulator
VWEDAGPTTFLSIALDHSLIRSTAEEMGLDPDGLVLEPELQIKDPRLEHIGWALKAELEARDSGGRLYAEGLGRALAAQLLRRFECLGRGQSDRGLTRRQRRAVTDYIEQHIAADLSLRELADIAGVSASHFRSLFKESMGVPPHQYVIQRRVRHATRMLMRGAPRLSEVALRTGFADQSHMARCMRRLLGMTPSTVLRQRK